jgi:hypothetical protein
VHAVASSLRANFELVAPVGGLVGLLVATVLSDRTGRAFADDLIRGVTLGAAAGGGLALVIWIADALRA